MKEKAKRSPAEGEFLFEIDPQPLEECVTALGGVPLWVRAIRSLDVPGSVQRHLQIKQRERGFDEATYIESFLVLNAVGGDCVEDFEPLREDAGLAARLGHPVPSAEAARKFLYQFHDEAKIEQAQRELPSGRASYIPGESAPLRGLAQVNVVVADEFRDGNVPAQQAPLPVTQRGFQALPKTVTERYFRGDSACDEDSLLSWLRDEKRADGPPGRIGFAVSARMHPALHQEIVATAEAQW